MLTNAGTAERSLARQPPNLEKAKQLIGSIITDGKRPAISFPNSSTSLKRRRHGWEIWQSTK